MKLKMHTNSYSGPRLAHSFNVFHVTNRLHLAAPFITSQYLSYSQVTTAQGERVVSPIVAVFIVVRYSLDSLILLLRLLSTLHGYGFKKELLICALINTCVMKTVCIIYIALNLT